MFSSCIDVYQENVKKRPRKLRFVLRKKVVGQFRKIYLIDIEKHCTRQLKGRKLDKR